MEEKYNPMKSAEIATEHNYNIDLYKRQVKGH